MQNTELQDLLETIQSQIRAFDTKAQVALGLDGLLAGLLGTEIVKCIEYGAAGMHFRLTACVATCTVALISTFISFLYALRTVHPRLHLSQPSSHFFFCHLANLYGRDYERAARKLKGLSEYQIGRQLGTQIQTNAVICTTKAERCGKALNAGLAGLIGYLLSLYPLASMAYEAATKTVAHPK